MPDLWIIFLTGLTTGGLSCLAVQGGLLASSVAKQAEVDIVAEAKHSARPIVVFLGSKVVAYTILGALLGAAGAVLQLTPYMRAALQIIIGLYMLGLAMHLLGVHPFFRYFMPQPPRALTRYIRRKAKSGTDDLVTPAFLGALTVFIPCGVTVAMMAVAVGTGNALTGATVMLAFTIGTTPLFFTLAYGAAKLGAKKQAVFLKFAAVAVIVLGLFSIEGGLNLAGSPVSYSNIRQSLSNEEGDSVAQAAPAPASPAPASAAPPAQAAPTAPGAASQTLPAAPPAEKAILRMTASIDEYAPSVIKAKAGQPYTLEITARENFGCGRGFTIPSLGVQKVLPEDGVETIDIPAQKKGTMRMTCSMGMYNAQIKFE